MAFCEQCGNKLNEGTKFCGKCGTAVHGGQTETTQANIDEASVFCSQCETQLEEGEVFCPNCGAKAGKGLPISSSAPSLSISTNNGGNSKFINNNIQGTYCRDEKHFLLFSGNSFTGLWNGVSTSGRFTVLDNTVTIKTTTGQLSQRSPNSEVFTINDSNVNSIDDSFGNTWTISEPINIMTDFMDNVVTFIFEGKEIVAKNDLLSVKLFVDGQLIGENKSLFAPIFNTLWIEGKYKFDSCERTIQVFAKSGLVSVKLQIFVLLV